MNINFKKKIETLYKSKQFESIKFEIEALDDNEKEDPFYHNILGVIELLNKNYSKAKKYFNFALKLDKYYIHSLLNLAKLAYLDKDFIQTINMLKEYNAKNPGDHNIILNLADLTFGAGTIEDTIYYHKILINSGKYETKDLAALIFLLNYSNTYSKEEYKKYCEKFNKIIFKNKINYKFTPNDHDKSKIGFLSYDLKQHSVGYFLKDFVKILKDKNLKPIAFNLSKERKDDNFTNNFKKAFFEWNDVSNLNDKEISDLIYSKRIYYLFDLGGYSNGNRLQVYKNKPAPVQISWLGYCNETHIEEIDHMIVDDYIISDDLKDSKSKLISMPHIWNTISKLEDVQVNELPYIKNKHFNFGCFNNFLKISSYTINMWEEILHKFENSNLILKNSSSADINFKDYIIKKFKKEINPQRIKILNYELDKKKHLEQYNNIDLCLDTYPYNGVTTTFEALWMGVPVVTLKGDRFVSRCGYSINKNSKLSNYIANNKQEYISIATQFKNKANIEKLLSVRKKLRSQVLQSPLFDIDLFVKNFILKLNTINEISK